jgi:hypothetical protein
MTLGVLGSLEDSGPPRGSGGALTTRSAATRRVTAPTLPSLNAPFDPRAMSTVCSQYVAASARWWPHTRQR